MSRFDSDVDALAEELDQNIETVTRSSRIDIVSSGVDEIDPPEELDEYAEQAKSTGVVRKNLRQFTNDVWEPGYRLEADSDQTADFFTGGPNAPEVAPEGGFLENSAVFGGERHQDFYSYGKEKSWQRWVRGTILTEYLYRNPSQQDSPITGFHFIRPETLYPQVQNNTNILLPPDAENLPEDISEDEVTKTKRDEVAAYIQFDDESILGLRGDFSDKNEVPLSQNDVMKQVLEPDIGDDFGSETQGVFGTSIIAGISEDIAEYKQIKRDRAQAIKTKAWGLWDASFGREVLDVGAGQKEIIEWGDDDMADYTQELEGLEPGEVATHDGTIEFDRFPSEVPDLEDTINQYVNIMLAPLPAPKYLVGFAEGINRDVTSEQQEGYQDLISEERRYQSSKWTAALKKVAESWGLDPSGLELKIEEEEESNPIKAWNEEQMTRANTYISSLAEAAGPQAGPTSLVSRDAILEVLDFPTDEIEDGEQAVSAVEEELGEEAAREAWEDIMGVEALAAFEAGSWVETPDGEGIVDEPVTGGSVGGLEASEDNPVYPVALVDDGHDFYQEGELEGTESPSVEGVDNPEAEVEEALNALVADASDMEALQFGEFNYPDSWEESPTPNRVILLDAFSSMGGTFTGARQELGSARLAASMKDAVWMTHDWRGGWTD